MDLESLRTFHKLMLGFDQNEIILVIFDELTNTITYFQNSYKESKTVIASVINHMYFPSKFRYGILTPEKYTKLMNDISFILSSGVSEDPTLMTLIGKMEVSFYNNPRNIGQFNPGPQLIKKLQFVTFTNPLVIRLILRFYSPISRLLLKKIKYDKKHRDDKLIEKFQDQVKKEELNLNNLNKR